MRTPTRNARSGHRIALIRHAAEVRGSVALTCRYYGISRPTFYRWLRQWEELGEAGLRDASSKPLLPAPQQHPGRGEDHVPAFQLSLRAAEDLDAPEALQRRRGLQVRGVAILNRLDSRPSTSQASRPPLERVRENLSSVTALISTRSSLNPWPAHERSTTSSAPRLMTASSPEEVGRSAEVHSSIHAMRSPNEGVSSWAT
jgi:transposase-like protein